MERCPYCGRTYAEDEIMWYATKLPYKSDSFDYFGDICEHCFGILSSSKLYVERGVIIADDIDSFDEEYFGLQTIIRKNNC